MSDVVERVFGDLVVRIDRRLCVGFGDCVEEAPETFVLDGEDLAGFVDGGGPGDSRDRLIAACEACPVDALTLAETDGREATG